MASGYAAPDMQAISAPPAAPALGGFIGRKRELAEVGRLLASARLVTLTGPGGVGKSRLALEAAAAASPAFADGLTFVPLVAVRDPELVLPAIAQAVGAADRGARPLFDAVAEELRGRGLLLLLDNFEQVAAAAPLVADLLVAVPSLTALVTSRVALHLPGEVTFPVPPLPVPDPAAAVPSDEVLAYDAVQLFVERARAARHSFAPGADDAPVIGEVCRRLDGLPLAIELAAGHLRALDPAALLGRLERRLPLPAGAEARPDRQRTMRAAIAWSHDLLGEPERRLFRRLAVFEGGCTPESAEAICQDAGCPVTSGLSALLDQHLLRRLDRGDAPRVGMLETIREFAIERLDESGERDAVAARHAAHFLTLAEATAAADGRMTAEGVQRSEREHANFGAALRHFLDQRDAERGLRLAVALRDVWGGQGHYREGRAYLRALLALPTAEVAPELLAAAFSVAAILAHAQGDYAEARAVGEALLNLRRQLGDPRGIAETLTTLGLIRREEGDNAAAARLLEESLARYRELGQPEGIALALDLLGTIDRVRGEYGLAGARYAESLEISRRVRFRLLLGWTPHNLGRLAVERGDLAGARAWLGESLLAHRRYGDMRGLAHALAALTGLAAAEGRPERAVRLAGAAEALCDAARATLQPSERGAFEAGLAAARAALPGDIADRAWAEGRSMTIEQAIVEALSVTAGADRAD